MFRSSSLTYLIFISAAVAYDSDRLSGKIIQWTGGSNFDWPCATTKSLYKSSGRYIGKNVIATRAVIYKDVAFLALPRYRPGVPATLAKVSLKSKSSQSTLSPFPCWSLQEESNCAALQSAVDIFLDPQDILWVLDVGVVNTMEKPLRHCPPKVMAINVKTGKIVKTVDISFLTTDISRLQYIVADYSNNGHVFVYISDAANRAILVYDVTSDRGYRVILPKAVTVGCTIRDVLYLMLIRSSDGTNNVFFTYLSSKNIFSIKSVYLQNGSTHSRVNDLGPKRDKVIFLGNDNGGAVFFRKEGESDVYRWDLTDYPVKESINKVYTGNSCALPTQVMPDYKKSRMRILESNFPDYFHGTVGCGINHFLKVF